jgi:hypothetical protein
MKMATRVWPQSLDDVLVESESLKLKQQIVAHAVR